MLTDSMDQHIMQDDVFRTDPSHPFSDQNLDAWLQTVNPQDLVVDSLDAPVASGFMQVFFFKLADFSGRQTSFALRFLAKSSQLLSSQPCPPFPISLTTSSTTYRSTCHV